MARALYPFSLPLRVGAAALLAACAAGPDYVAPPAPDVVGYDSTPTPAQTSDAAQDLALNEDIPAEWWTLFRSTPLNDLMARAIKENPDLASAEAALRVAESESAARESAFFPAIGGNFSSERQKTSPASSNGIAPSATYTLHNASISASYALDVFGGTRRAVEEAQAQTDAARFQKEAALLTLTGNVATAAIKEASLRAQIAAAQAVIADQQKTLLLFQARFAAGAVGQSALASQRALVAEAEGALPPLTQELAQTRHLLSVLVGQMPQREIDSAFSLADLHLPARIPLSVPAKLVDQRPDIRAAAENLHAASAAIGVAQAARLPQITLSANIGSMATVFNQLLAPGGGFWMFSGSVAQSLFDGGASADREDAARAAFDEAAAQYRKTVLTAFENVADALHALQSDADLLRTRTAANKAAQDALAIAKAQLSAGATDATTVLTAENTAQTASAAQAQATAQRLADTAALFVALGGGWWNRDKTADKNQTGAP